MWSLTFVLCLLALSVVPSRQQVCDPASCVLPKCRCADDPDPPGKLERDTIPQIVIVSFENALNSQTVDNYTYLLENVVNPNGCAVKGSFYIRDEDTNYDLVRELFDDGHEIGVNSKNGIIPDNAEGWREMIKGVLDNLGSVGINSDSVYGVRAPEFFIGGDEEFIGIGDNGLLYDSSCTSFARSKKEDLIWPYTYDFKGPTCDNGNPPEDPFPGKWEFYIADLEWNGVPCATPAACPGIETQRDAFDVFYNSFQLHYEEDGKRTPFVMVINPVWAETENYREGTHEFIQYLRAALSDVWIVTAHQALQWIQDPTPLANITDFKPWQCPPPPEKSPL